jgi:hypothetical protein
VPPPLPAFVASDHGWRMSGANLYATARPLANAHAATTDRYNAVMISDVFISHASEDKEAIARPLEAKLKSLGYTVWFDEFVLKLGDGLRRSIDRGLANCRFGVVILSHNFFAKNWPQQELDGLAAREANEKTKRILPIWHQLSFSEVAGYSPMLADRLGVTTDKGLDEVVRQIVDVLGPPQLIAPAGQSSPSEPSVNGTAAPVDFSRASASVSFGTGESERRRWWKELRAKLRECHAGMLRIRTEAERRGDGGPALMRACEELAQATEPVIELGISAVKCGVVDAEEVASVSRELLDCPGWNPSGLMTLINLCYVPAFVYHHVVGAYAIHEEDQQAAILLLMIAVGDVRGDQQAEVWRKFPLMGGGQFFNNDVSVSWGFLENRWARLGSVARAFSDEEEFKQCLRAYVMLGSTLELVEFISKGGDFKALNRQTSLDVYPWFLSKIGDGAEINRIMRRAVPRATITAAVAKSYNVPPDKLRQHWPSWLRFILDVQLSGPGSVLGFLADRIYLTAPMNNLP